MKLLFDLFPVILFFVAFKFYDIYIATGVAIAASVVQIGWLLARRRPVAGMQWASLAIIVVFGGLTLFLHDETFIKWKPTVLYAAFALSLLVSRYAFGKNLIKAMMGAQVTLPVAIWTRLNLGWTIFFAAMAVLNIYVAYNYPTATWVNFKLFGTMGLTLVFVLAQAFYIGRFIEEAK
ncbi:MAG: septation protein A [Burkholderiaceae bacterium]|nr:septation protein A [Burkholderiaceae bacterium]